MTTRLAGDATRFLPFNRGSNPGGVHCGAGNPAKRRRLPHGLLLEGRARTRAIPRHPRQLRFHRDARGEGRRRRGRPHGEARDDDLPRAITSSMPSTGSLRRLVPGARGGTTSSSIRPAAARRTASRGSRTASRACTPPPPRRSSTASSSSRTAASSTASCRTPSTRSSTPRAW